MNPWLGSGFISKEKWAEFADGLVGCEREKRESKLILRFSSK